MQHSEFKQKGTSPCSSKKMPLPEFISCVKCGEEVEIWTDEDETHCPVCMSKIFKKQSTVH